MRKKGIRIALPLLLAGFIGFCLFSMPEVCTNGVKEGILVCGSTVIPSLFPFMAVSGFLLQSGLTKLGARTLTPLTRRLFRLPGECAGVIFMSLVGGFPIGAKMAAQLIEQKRITQNQAMRMCLFCIGAGPAFVISAVGYSVFKSTRAGVLLYASTCLAALLFGMLVSAFDDGTPIEAPKKQIFAVNSPATALTEAVSGAIHATLNICAWVLLFSCISACIEHASLPEQVKLLFHCILEVTDGVNAAAGRLPLPAVAAILSFAGLSVHCQLLKDLQICGVKFAHFLASRGICAALSAVICAGLLKLFPCEISVFASSSPLVPAAYSVSIPSFIALMVMSLLLILEVESKKKV